MTRIKWMILLVFVLATGIINAQKDTISQINDSLKNIQLLEFNQKLSEIEAEREKDSLKRLELEKELASLQSTDNLKKEELLEQLEELNQKDAERLEKKKQQIEEIRTTAMGFPVMGFFDDTLFVIYSKIGSFSPADRAIAITDKINKLADVFSSGEDTLLVVESEGTFDVVFGDMIIVSVTENDGIWNNDTAENVALSYAKIIQDEITRYQDEMSTVSILKKLGLVLLVLVLTIVVLYFTIKLFRLITKKIELQEGKKLKGIKIKNYTLFDSKREVKAILFVSKLLKWAIMLILMYIALPILFGIFPQTRNFSDKLFGYVLNPVKKILGGFIDYLPNLITIIVIILIYRWAMRGIKFLKSEVENGNLKLNGFYPDWANPTYHIIRILLLAFVLVVIFPYLPGSESPVFQGVSVFLGFLLTFGSAGSLSNIIAGLVLTYMRLFRIGDRVKIGEVVGDVIEKSLLVTRIRTTKNEIISIPNSTVMNSHTINFSSDAPEKGLIVHTTVTIGYDVPWKKMHEVLIEAAGRTDLILKDPVPFVLQTSLDDFYVSYEINGYVKEPNKQAKIYSDLHQHIQDVCNEQGIEILSPHYRAARDGNNTTIPSDYLPKDYVAPSFKIKTDK